MTSDASKGPKPFPTARTGASDDDIFAEMGRMLAQDQSPRPRKVTTAPAEPAPVPPAAEEPPLELTQVVARGRTGAKAEPPPTVKQPDVATAPRPAVSRPASPPADLSAPPMPRPTAPAASPVPPARSDDITPSTSGFHASTRSLDEIVEAALRPMIKEWLDQNLERIVREQLAEVASEAEKSK